MKSMSSVIYWLKYKFGCFKDTRILRLSIRHFELIIWNVKNVLTLGRPGVGGYHPLAFFPVNFFDDSNGKNRLIVSSYLVSNLQTLTAHL